MMKRFAFTSGIATLAMVGALVGCASDTTDEGDNNNTDNTDKTSTAPVSSAVATTVSSSVDPGKAPVAVDVMRFRSIGLDGIGTTPTKN